MALLYRRIADNAADGPLVVGIGGIEAAVLAATNPTALVQYVNANLQAALKGLPEGTRVEIDISGWSLPLVGSVASRAASQVNQAWRAGQIDYGGEPIQPWPEYPDQVAWGDDSSATVTIRTLVGQWEALLFVFIGILVVAAVWVLWDNWRSPSTPWQAQVAYSPGQQPPVTGQGILAWLVRNWPWVLLAGGALAAAPFVVRKVAEVREAENELAAAERGVF